ncbi:MAG: LysM peptidoglycan-binding protein [Actinomycetia bacterium]|nr:LysM peptidoglycan-binding protein [Actinomycetes bacterium]
MRTRRAYATLLVLLLFALLASAGTYRVRRGDTLGAIAQKAGLSVGTLARANGIADPDHLREGQVLTIPSAAPAAPATVTVHRVGRGETLGAIAARYHTTVARLAQLNGIRNVNLVSEGAALRLDGGATWVCPVPAVVRFVSGFGDGRGERKHEGVDIAAPRGTTVVANVPGYLKRHPNPMGGNAYYLEGDDGSVYYGAHLDSYIAQNGHVIIGQAIGRVGETGNAQGTTPHLHFERMPGGRTAVDPLPLLVRACRYR